MKPFDRKHHNLSNCYQYLAGNIILDEAESESMPVFVHEYLHHFHNVTTVLGAERYNYFVQILSHFTRLAAAADHLVFPLSQWDAQDCSPAIAEELLQIVKHFEMWGYLDRANDKELSFPRPQRLPPDQLFSLAGIEVTPEFEMDIRLPAVATDDGDESVYHPVGGMAVSEASAFCLEQLWKDQPHPIGYLLTAQDEFQYHFTAHIAKSIFVEPEKIFLAGYLLADLAVTVSTPAAGFRMAIRRFVNQADSDWTIDQIAEWYLNEILHCKEAIDYSYLHEIQMLMKSVEELENFTSETIVRIREHAKTLIKGLQFRQQNPDVALKLLPVTEKSIQDLIQLFPPNVVQIRHQGWVETKSYTDDGHSEFLAFDLLMRFFFEAYYGKEVTAQVQASVLMDSEWVACGNGLFKIEIDMDNNTNATILREVLQTLCMEGKQVRLL